MRLFVALAPPDGALDHLEDACAPLRAGRDDLRWTNREAWHVTLAFLGEVPDMLTARLMPRLERAARRHKPVSLAFAGSGAFPRAGRANVLWCGLEGDRTALAELAASVAAGARRAGAQRAGEGAPGAGRKFQPHLTLARCRAPADVGALVAGLESYRGEPWTAAEIYLIQSWRSAGPGDRPPGTPATSRYEILGRWPLRTS
jgi:2'-5' RNA ligase